MAALRREAFNPTSSARFYKSLRMAGHRLTILMKMKMMKQMKIK